VLCQRRNRTYQGLYWFQRRIYNATNYFLGQLKLEGLSLHFTFDMLALCFCRGDEFLDATVHHDVLNPIYTYYLTFLACFDTKMHLIYCNYNCWVILSCTLRAVAEYLSSRKLFATCDLADLGYNYIEYSSARRSLIIEKKFEMQDVLIISAGSNPAFFFWKLGRQKKGIMFCRPSYTPLFVFFEFMIALRISRRV
jgi:hypothetical protein